MTCRHRCSNQCDQAPPNTSNNPYFGDIVAAGASRRTVLLGGGAAFAVAGSSVAAAEPAAAGGGRPSKRSKYVYDFSSIPARSADCDQVDVPRGFRWEPLLRWGDPILPGAPRFDFEHQTARAQERQFGYNCDYVGLVRTGRRTGLLSVNHEYTNEDLMFGVTDYAKLSDEQLRIAMAAHGLSVVEVRKDGKRWRARLGSRHNRRYTASTPFRLDGPAAGDPLVRTSADPKGRTALGTFNNCSGGTTPWGTTLHGEENIHGYFNVTSVPEDQQQAYERYGFSGTGRGWERVDPRFDTGQEPNEPNRHGWIVEIDPTDPRSTPRKHTAMGRFKHEGANVIIDEGGHAVAYMGDDEKFEYMYKFVSRDKYRKRDRQHNLTLLSEGDLYVAKFTGDGFEDGVSDGTGQWLALVKDGASMVADMTVAEVLVNVRTAADRLGATKMDRPEDVDINPVNGRVYGALTNNDERSPSQIDEANPRALNKHGQIIEITPHKGDHTSTRCTWKLVLIAGDPDDPATYFNGYDKSEVTSISCPDNVAFDGRGDLWISTDGNKLGHNDGFFLMPLKGRDKGKLQRFLNVPTGAEACGPLIVDDATVFCAVQHPGEIDGATPENPASQFPYERNRQPRPSVIQVWKER
nr:PhoX family phosphatase [Demetria terragena]